MRQQLVVFKIERSEGWSDDRVWVLHYKFNGAGRGDFVHGHGTDEMDAFANFKRDSHADLYDIVLGGE